MDSCISFPGHDQYIQVEEEKSTIFPIKNKHPSSRRTRSFSCSSSFGSSSSSFGSSSFDSSPPSSPITALRFSGVPFSWEQQPGIPKKYMNSPSKYKDGSLVLLPLPPPPNPTPSKRFNLESIFSTQKKNFHTDPFVAALMECSRDRGRDGLDDCWKEKKVSRTLSDRLGFIDLYASCKNSCDVSDSTVLIPRSSRGSYYHLLNRRTG